MQPGQIVAIGSEPGKEELTRALAAAAYRPGREVRRPWYFDLHVKRARLQHAAEDTLDFVPAWYGERAARARQPALRADRAHRPGEPGLLDDLDPARVGRDQLPSLPRPRGRQRAHDELDGVPVPDAARGRGSCTPTSPPDAALRALLGAARSTSAASTRTTRSPPGASASDALVGAAERLTERRFDRAALRGPGHRPDRRAAADVAWMAARFETVDGIVHMPNLPTEEVFTAPDPQRVDGVVRSTKPLVRRRVDHPRPARSSSAAAARCEIDADEGAEVLRAYAERDEGAARLGEVALVDGDGPHRPARHRLLDTLLDENAASPHRARPAYAFTAGDEDHARLNERHPHRLHVGGPGVDVDGVERDGSGEVPVLCDGRWEDLEAAVLRQLGRGILPERAACSPGCGFVLRKL